MRQGLTVFLLTSAISTFCVANENNSVDLSSLSNEKIAAAREYYEASNIEGQMKDSMARSMDEAWIKNGALLEFFTIINAEIFSTEELAELTAFYKTPVGIKSAKFASKASSRLSELMMPIMVEFQNRFPEIIMQEAIAFCEKNKESDFCKGIAESA